MFRSFISLAACVLIMSLEDTLGTIDDPLLLSLLHHGEAEGGVLQSPNPALDMGAEIDAFLADDEATPAAVVDADVAARAAPKAVAKRHAKRQKKRPHPGAAVGPDGDAVKLSRKEICQRAARARWDRQRSDPEVAAPATSTVMMSYLAPEEQHKLLKQHHPEPNYLSQMT